MLKPEGGRLYREEALDHYLRAEGGGEPLRVSPPWTWALFWSLGALLLGGLALALWGRVEVTTRARGILRPLPGVQVLTAQVGGTVTRVHASAGRRLEPGDEVLALDSAPLQAQLQEAERQLQILESDYSAFGPRMDGHHREQEASLNARLNTILEQEASLRESLGVFQRKLKATEELAKAGLVATLSVDEAREALAQAQRQLGASRQALAQVRQEGAGLRGRRTDDLWRHEQERQQARSKRDGLRISLAQTRLRASMAGVLETLLVKPGDVVPAGAPVGRIVPMGAPMRVVAFLPEKDRAFIREGGAARLELDQLPHAEFGTLPARITRIADDLATTQEIQEAMGEAAKLEGPAFRVELAFEGGAEGRMAGLPMRPGMLLQARFILRRQRPIAFLLNPLKAWMN